MEDPLVVSLIIAGIGMTLLFLTLGFFYGLLSWMTATLQDRPATSLNAAGGNVEGAGEEEATIQAAVIAVALARARAEQGVSPVSARPEEPAAGAQLVSPWWALHHQRQLALNPKTRRTR